MNKSEFFQLFKSEVDTDGVYPNEINDDTPLSDFDNWDSLSRALVYNFVERELKVRMNHADLRECKTVGDITLLLGLDE